MRIIKTFDLILKVLDLPNLECWPYPSLFWIALLWQKYQLIIYLMSTEDKRNSDICIQCGALAGRHRCLHVPYNWGCSRYEVGWFQRLAFQPLPVFLFLSVLFLNSVANCCGHPGNEKNGLQGWEGWIPRGCHRFPKATAHISATHGMLIQTFYFWK